MTFSETDIPGCFEIELPVFSDQRGKFVKTLSLSRFAEHGLATGFVETFHTISAANVLRGMHFQLPPADHAKIVYCLGGRILDVCLDLRLGSPFYGRHWATEISADQNRAVYMPSGIAHGFYVLEPPALTVYHVTTEHNAGLDTGIAWDSFGMQWPAKMPLISSRDSQWPKLGDFKSPFRFQSGKEAGREAVRP